MGRLTSTQPHTLATPRTHKSKSSAALSKAVTVRIYVLRISLLGSCPEIWRRLRVPSDCTLRGLHEIIQIAMGWSNNHKHQFDDGVALYSPVHEQEIRLPPDIMLAPNVQSGDESFVCLHDVAPRIGRTLMYKYDPCDEWQHSIVVQSILDVGDLRKGRSTCIDGARACPPEDCGGIRGYAGILEAYADPRHPEHQITKEWLAREFDPDEFSTAEVNSLLFDLGY